MFADVQGRFGVPDVLTSYIVGRTKDFTPPDAVYWPYHQSSVQTATPEERVKLRVLFQHEGKDIVEARGPRELLECILHAMIGEYELVCVHITVFERSSQGTGTCSRTAGCTEM